MPTRPPILGTLIAVHVALSSSMALGLQSPNIVVILADDLGYGDLQCFGHPSSVTPNINKLALEGQIWTNFYSTSPVCSPSRSSLLTGKYQVRTGVWGAIHGVFGPGSIGGLNSSVSTIADVLGTSGYATGMVGKWHLGIGADHQYLPTQNGFQSYYGIPFSNDMCPCPECFYHTACSSSAQGASRAACDWNLPGCPIFANATIVEQPADKLTLSKKYIARATEFLSSALAHGHKFFLLYASHHTHYPQFGGRAVTNSTSRGRFGDSLLELDWEVGRLVAKLGELGVERETLIVFTSDNGPSLLWQQLGGDSGPLKCGKGTTYEGGVRVPAIFHWPGTIAHSYEHGIGSLVDLLPTLAKLSMTPRPSGPLDGYDLSGTLLGKQPSPRKTFAYYPVLSRPARGVYAVRYNQFKAHFHTCGSQLSDPCTNDPDCLAGIRLHDPPIIYDLEKDPGEKFPILANSTILKRLKGLKHHFDATVLYGRSEMDLGVDEKLSPCCKRNCTPWPSCCVC